MRNRAKPTVQPHTLEDHHARFARWLAVAALLHALLLLIPARHALSPGPTLTTLTVTLSSTLRAPPATPVEKRREDRVNAEQRQAPSSVPAAESAPAVAPAAAPAFAPALEPPGPAPGDAVPSGAESAPVTTARLLDSANRREWSPPEPSGTPRLGVLTPPTSNRRAGTAADSTPLSGTTLPARTGIVDQWLAADGSRNFMIRTPTGQLLCGRTEAWNPMNPLVEPVMMYRACGGGRRTFEMPARPGRVLLR